MKAFFRPELRAVLSRWSEVLSGLAVAGFGLWALQAQDQFFQLLAALVVLAGMGLALIGWRRLRFKGSGTAPGIVQVVEGQISYFGPDTGGFIALRDLIELHLTDRGQTWLLVSADDTRLEIPVAASGSEALFDAFASLDGLRMSMVLAALEDSNAPPTRALWLHPARQGQHLGLR
ncbi:MAG: hypothetical protein EA407_12640 [Rhodobacteraceae bacterium]|nr:MAG: hypothetical protein EA407_12640 [Paracoccaceae bacterium]